MQINWLYLTGILRTMRQEAEAAERREEDINPAALVQFAQMIEDALRKGGAAMINPKKTMIDDYTQQLEQMTLASEDLSKLEAVFEAIEVMIEKDPFSMAAKRLACVGHELAKDRADYFINSADDLETTIDRLETEVETEEGEE